MRPLFLCALLPACYHPGHLFAPKTSDTQAETGAPDSETGDSSPGDSEPTDADGDGYDLLEDCDDADPDVNPGAAEACDGVDNDCDDEVDEDFPDSDGDDIANCVDETIYAYDFDDEAWTGWSVADLGGDNAAAWSMTDGTLGELSDAAISIAYGPDLGDLDAFTISVRSTSAGSMNDVAAIVFGFEDSSSYLMARWLDPNGYYGNFPDGGNVDLAQCSYTKCTSIAADSSSGELVADYGTWVSLSVTVADGQASVGWEGATVLTTDLPEGTGTVPSHIGLFTYDNDGGVYYDDIAVTAP